MIAPERLAQPLQTPYLAPMFEALIRRLVAPAPNRLPEPDARLALASFWSASPAPTAPMRRRKSTASTAF